MPQARLGAPVRAHELHLTAPGGGSSAAFAGCQRWDRHPAVRWDGISAQKPRQPLVLSPQEPPALQPRNPRAGPEPPLPAQPWPCSARPSETRQPRDKARPRRPRLGSSRQSPCPRTARPRRHSQLSFLNKNPSRGTARGAAGPLSRPRGPQRQAAAGEPQS